MSVPSSTGGAPPLKEWADSMSAQWRRKYGVDELAAWERGNLFRLPSGREVMGWTVAQCKRYRKLGAERLA